MQDILQSLARKQQGERVVPKTTAMLAEKGWGGAGANGACHQPTTELLQDPMNPDASEALASTAEQLQAHAALQKAMVASYRLAVVPVGGCSSDASEHQTEPLGVGLIRLVRLGPVVLPATRPRG